MARIHVGSVEYAPGLPVPVTVVHGLADHPQCLGRQYMLQVGFPEFQREVVRKNEVDGVGARVLLLPATPDLRAAEDQQAQRLRPGRCPLGVNLGLALAILTGQRADPRAQVIRKPAPHT